MMRFSSVLIASAMFALGCEGDTDTGDDGDGDDVGDTDTDTMDTDTDTTTGGGTTGIACGTDGVGILQGTITDNLTLGTDCNWLLSGGVTIGDDTNETILTILPGVTVYGEGATNGFLAISRGSKIMAEGTAAEPIIFTSDAVGAKARGQWGGVILNGRAPINAAGGEAVGEGGTGNYGGTVANDNSGVLKYVRVEYGGIAISPDNEINGVSFAGVGSGTEIDYLQVHANGDDGMEFFGGTVNAKHLVVSCPNDDSFDWDLGYVGKIQYAVAVQGCDLIGNNGIEADNEPAIFDALPRSNPTISNLTMVGNVTGPDGHGILLRHGTDVTLTNTILTDFPTSCLAIRDDSTYNAMPDIDHTIVDCATSFETDDDDDLGQEDAIFAAGTGNSEADPQLVNTSLAGGDPNFAPASGSPAATGGAAPSDSFFQSASYLGAFDPAGTDWTDGWTNWDL
jgi:hypothetical protein